MAFTDYVQVVMEYHSICSIVLAIVLDLLLGDPYFLPHPVRWMGRLIGLLETLLYPQAQKRQCMHALTREDSSPQQNRTEVRRLFLRGMILTMLTVLVTGLAAGGIWFLAWRVHPICGLLAETIMGYQVLAMRCLAKESGKVYRKLAAQDVEGARAAVSMLVGRDTDRLDAAGIAKAAVETVAENTSDGVIAPLFYLILGGPVLAMMYKAVNTMDSMIGYKNDRYRHFGTAAAKLDDFVNFVPARISALLLIAASLLPGYSLRGAWRIWRRDRFKHASPNSAQTEAAAAGALSLQLAGDAWYFGKLVHKETIGGTFLPEKTIEPRDIVRMNRLMYAGCLLGAVIGVGLRGVIIWL